MSPTTKASKRKRTWYTYFTLGSDKSKSMFSTDKTLKQNCLEQRQRRYLKNLKDVQEINERISKGVSIDEFRRLNQEKSEKLDENKELLEICADFKTVAIKEGQGELRDDPSFAAYMRGLELFDYINEKEVIRELNAEEMLEKIKSEEPQLMESFIVNYLVEMDSEDFKRFVNRYLKRIPTSEVKNFLAEAMSDHLMYIALKPIKKE